MLAGFPTLAHKPKTVGPDFIFDEDTPFIAAGPFKLVAHKDGAPDGVETEQLHTRLQYSLFFKRRPEGVSEKRLRPVLAMLREVAAARGEPPSGVAARGKGGRARISAYPSETEVEES